MEESKLSDHFLEKFIFDNVPSRLPVLTKLKVIKQICSNDFSFVVNGCRNKKKKRFFSKTANFRRFF